MLKPALRPCLLLLVSAVLAAQEPHFDTLRQEGHWKQLRPRIEGWYRAKPEDPYALLWMSRLKEAFGASQVALDLARRAVALKPTDSELQTQLGRAADAARRKVPLLKQYSLAKEQQRALETAVAANPASEEAVNKLVRYYLAAPAIAGGSVTKARDLAQRYTQIKPSAGLVFQALIAIFGKDAEGAKALLERAVTADSHQLMAYRELVTLYLGRKPQALDAAAACCRKALEANPTAIEAHATLAGVLAEQGKFIELEACLAQARHACPDDLRPFFQAGVGLIETRHKERAETLLKTYLSQDPEGFAPDHALCRANLAVLYTQQGRRPEAIRELEQALVLRPDFDWARKELERLKKG